MATKEEIIKVNDLVLKLKEENAQIFYALKNLLFDIKKESY